MGIILTGRQRREAHTERTKEDKSNGRNQHSEEVFFFFEIFEASDFIQRFIKLLYLLFC